MPKRVLTLSQDDLTAAADELFGAVVNDGFVPDAIVGIESGGRYVVEALTSPGGRLLFCRMTRKSTETKELGTARRVLRRLPYALADRLRILEDRMSSGSQPVVPVPTEELRAGVEGIVEVVRREQLSRLLIVDDAVDSGGTLACVLTTLRGCLPQEVELRSAVVTTTRPPALRVITPDYTLHALVLCRFPWSFDYRGAT
jgi:hypoxanthine phosphoribosyltransferase